MTCAPEVATTCPYCGVGCGIIARRTGGGAEVRGDPDHPANFGRLCSKGLALGETLGYDDRLLHPTIRGRRASWARATRLVAGRFRRAIERHGPESVAFYVSGQLLTEDYYAANKLMKGFIGSSNIDTNSRLCMASAVSAHKIAFGADLVPGNYEDLDAADLVVFAGHNAAWTHPVLFRRMEAARTSGQRHVVIDPRRTETAQASDLFLQIRPQTDVRLWNGLLADLDRRGAWDLDFLRAHARGWEEVRQSLRVDDNAPGAVAADCGLEIADLLRFYDLFADRPKTVTLFSMGSNQSAQGTSKGLAILNAHLATGRVGKPGAAPFSITGQPNAMGGRETGGMATTLAAHMEFEAEARARVGRFWGTDRVSPGPGMTAVDLFDAVGAGQVKALWIMATNPAVSLPSSDAVRGALERCPFVVVSDCAASSDTAALADVVLPALAWGEKDGTVTNSERRISRQRAFLPPPGEARADWRIIADVAAQMGYGDAFAWRGPQEVFAEWARLTAYENEDGRPGRRTLDLSGLAGISAAAYADLAPVQWPVRAGGASARLFADGVFPTSDGRARMSLVAPAAPAEPTGPGFPLALNTGRLRDQWHTMTRTGLSASLARHAPEPFVELHPEDAAAAGVVDGTLVRVTTRAGVAVALARVTPDQRRGGLFMPMHFSDAFAPSGRVNRAVTATRDPVSGQPEFKHTPARVAAYGETFKGFVIDRAQLSPPPRLDLVWRRVPIEGGHLHEFAGRGGPIEAALVKRALRGPRSCELIEAEDPSRGLLRQAFLGPRGVERILFITSSGALPPRSWLCGLVRDGVLRPEDRAALLSGRPASGRIDVSPLICACNNISRQVLLKAVEAGATNLDALAQATGAGSSCGSCRPEIARLLPSPRPHAELEVAL